VTIIITNEMMTDECLSGVTRSAIVPVTAWRIQSMAL
jgi:hypothetical protein